MGWIDLGFSGHSSLAGSWTMHRLVTVLSLACAKSRHGNSRSASRLARFGNSVSPAARRPWPLRLRISGPRSPRLLAPATRRTAAAGGGSRPIRTMLWPTDPTAPARITCWSGRGPRPAPLHEPGVPTLRQPGADRQGTSRPRTLRLQ